MNLNQRTRKEQAMKTKIAIVLTVVSMLIATTALADNWECTSNGSSSGESLCYVSYVRFYPGNGTYVKAKLHDPSGDTTCNYVRIKVGTGGSGPGSVDEVRAAQAMLLTALTTGLPIKFWRLTSYGNSSECYAGTVIVSKPGH
jgi:hypothetical protein